MILEHKCSIFGSKSEFFFVEQFHRAGSPGAEGSAADNLMCEINNFVDEIIFVKMHEIYSIWMVLRANTSIFYDF